MLRNVAQSLRSPAPDRQALCVFLGRVEAGIWLRESHPCAPQSKRGRNRVACGAATLSLLCKGCVTVGYVGNV